MENPSNFNKRIYTARGFVSDLRFLISHMPQIRKVMKAPAINKTFLEKIMTVVTAVNGCVYCSWFHAHQALASGISEEELRNLVRMQFKQDATDFEVPALLYAQHYAETDRHPEAEMEKRLELFYGRETAAHIRLIIRMIFFGNLGGNTFDAFLSRWKGRPAQNSNVLFEFLFFIFGAPFLLPLLPAVKKYRG